jgi:thioredoxin 1
MKKTIIFVAVALVFILGVAGLWRFQFSGDVAENSLDTAKGPLQEGPGLFKDIPQKGTVTMLDLGADSCIPCKMMAPIIEKLEKEYKGRADIIFIDVWKNPEQAKRFKVKAIPTQIFFDRDGKEVDRHVGFMKESAIVGKLKYLGVE